MSERSNKTHIIHLMYRAISRAGRRNSRYCFDNLKRERERKRVRRERETPVGRRTLGKKRRTCRTESKNGLLKIQTFAISTAVSVRNKNDDGARKAVRYCAPATRTRRSRQYGICVRFLSPVDIPRAHTSRCTRLPVFPVA